MKLIKVTLEGGPLDGQQIVVAGKHVTTYIARKMAYVLCELVYIKHEYKMNLNGKFIYKGIIK